MHGQGSVLYTNGDRYVGQFFENAMHGNGKYIHKNGDVFVGSFEKNVITGEGVETFFNGYEDIINDSSKFCFDSSRKTNRDVYSGEFRDNCRDGTGT
jgi:hypothetical protein